MPSLYNSPIVTLSVPKRESGIDPNRFERNIIAYWGITWESVPDKVLLFDLQPDSQSGYDHWIIFLLFGLKSVGMAYQSF